MSNATTSPTPNDHWENYLGHLTSEKAIRFERVFYRPTEEVWQYLTEEKLLPEWIADASVNLYQGGAYRAAFSRRG